MPSRSLSDTTVEFLKGSAVWKNLITDHDLRPEIRRDYITVYYRGGALLNKLRVNAGHLEAEIHRKFIPIFRKSQSEYVRLGSDDTGLRFLGKVEPLALGIAQPEVLGKYKVAMDQVLEKGFPEGCLVHKIVTNPRNLIIDQEIAFPGIRHRIDLCYFDLTLSKLVFVEVKRIVDGRLFAPIERPEVLDQLAAYCRRMNERRNRILTAFQTVVRLKQSLGMSDRLGGIPSGEPLDLLERPLLVIGGCSTQQRKAIRNGQGEWQPLMANLREVASGVIICGDVGCKLHVTNSAHSISYL